jgi:hypothetical protein
MRPPLSWEQVSDRLLAAQRVLNPGLRQPITHPLAVLLLSRPVASVMLGDEEATVLEFYDVYWVLEVNVTKTGFFLTQHDAVRYLQLQMER